MVACLLTIMNGHAQVTTPANSGGTGDFVGWDNTMINDPLQIRHDANQPIEWWTNNFNRMRVLPTVTGQTINTYPGLNLSGNLGIGAFASMLVNQPFSLLHLDAGGTQDSGFRPWMQSGMTITRQSDQGYFGLKDEGGASNHTVIAWSDNTMSHPGLDRLKFIFVANNVAANGVAGQLDGLEAARFSPDGGGNQSFFGVGDWFTAGVEPTERVDLLDGRMRIRQLPGDPEAEMAYRVMVVDDTSDPNERGVVKWVDPSVFDNGDCDWTVENDGVSGSGVSHHVYAAVGSSDDCPDADDAVGIGVDLSSATPIAKLDVHAAKYAIGERVTNVTNGASVQGLRVHVQNATDDLRGIQINTLSANNNINFGLRADVDGPTIRSRGLSARTEGATYTAYAGEFIADDNAEYTTGAIGWARNGKWRYGLDGRALGVEESYNIGVSGRAQLPTGCSDMSILLAATKVGVSGVACGLETELAIGVYGRSVDVTNNTWAGYFDGHVNINGDASCTLMAWTSDGNLKTGVEDLAGASAIIAQLQPRTYHFDAANHPLINLPSGMQHGFIAQELEEVLPELVSEVRFIGMVDSTGAEVIPGETVKAVNYVGLIPVLVSAMQEQNERILRLEEQLAACCINPGTEQRLLQGTTADEWLTDPRTERLLRIAPNPFTDRTTLYCTLERSGRMQLLVNSADGRDLRVLSEAQREAGEFQYEWSTENLVPGVYYITLLLDGEPLVKRAVKL